MRTRPPNSGRIDLSRIARHLSRECRARLDTAWGFPTHPAITATVAARIKPWLRSPDPGRRHLALVAVEVLILSREAPR